MKEIKANFEFERTFSLEENREKEREQKYLEWKKIGFGEKSSPRKVAELEAFLARKLQENLAEEARREHLDEITSRLWDAQTPDPPPRIRVHSAVSREDSRASSRNSRVPRTPVSRESTSHLTHSQSSASSRSSHHRRRDSSQGSASTTTSLSQRLLAGVNRSLQGSSTTSSRRASVSSSGVQSTVGTPRPRANNGLSLAIQELSMSEDEESEGWTTVPVHKRTHLTHRSSSSNVQPGDRRHHPPTTQQNNPASRSRQDVKILCVNWDNIGKFPTSTSFRDCKLTIPSIFKTRPDIFRAPETMVHKYQQPLAIRQCRVRWNSDEHRDGYRQPLRDGISCIFGRRIERLSKRKGEAAAQNRGN
jgi:hypothetical protein